MEEEKGNEKVEGALSSAVKSFHCNFPFPSQLHDKENLKFAHLVGKRSTHPLAFKPI